MHLSPSERPPEVWSVDVGGTTLPGLTLETAKEHTGVVVGRMHGMHVRPGQLLRHRVWQAHTITAQRGHTGQLRQGLLLSFFLLPSSVSLSSLPLYLSLTFFSCTPSPNPHKASSHIPLFSFCLSNCCALKKEGWREGNEIERKRQRENQRERGSYHRTSMARTNCTGPLK